MAAPVALVTVGTDHHRFDRLIDWVDRWRADHAESPPRWVIQHGASRPPRASGDECAAHDYLDPLELAEAIRAATIVITHGGPATITQVRRAGLLPVVVPRDPAHGEHVDDHQLRFARRLAASGEVVCCETEEGLRGALDRALRAPNSLRLDDSVEAASGASVRRVGQLIDSLLSPEQRPDITDWPSVSTVVATRDRPELVRRAIDSILGQDYPGRVECLVVFDQSDPDDGLAIDDRVTVLANDRKPGLPGARNTGILHARGHLVAFCDDDDRWLPGKLRAQVEAMSADPDADFVTCGIRIGYGTTRTDRSLPARHVTFGDLLRSRLTELHPSTFLIKRTALLNGIGLVDEEIPGGYGEDYELLLRAAKRAPIRNAPEVLTEVDWHPRSHFAGRWITISQALQWLLERYPEFGATPRGYARIAGQIAFALAAAGNRGAAARWAARAIRSNPLEARAYLGALVASGLVSGDRFMRALQRRGRGI